MNSLCLNKSRLKVERSVGRLAQISPPMFSIMEAQKKQSGILFIPQQTKHKYSTIDSAQKRPRFHRH